VSDERFRPDDGCPLFSDRLEEHLVAAMKGEVPNRGSFCGNCYTPIAAGTRACPHCGEPTDGPLRPVDRVPSEVAGMFSAVRKTERWIVNGFAYIGLTLAVVIGLAVVLSIPYLRAHLLPATIVYAIILIIGGRSLAGVLGGYYGDRLAFERARKRLREDWAEWVAARSSAAGPASGTGAAR